MTEVRQPSIPVSFTCGSPRCGKEFHKFLREVEDKNAIPCPHCGIVYDLSSEEGRAAIKEVKDEITKFRGPLGQGS